MMDGLLKIYLIPESHRKEFGEYFVDLFQNQRLKTDFFDGCPCFISSMQPEDYLYGKVGDIVVRVFFTKTDESNAGAFDISPVLSRFNKFETTEKDISPPNIVKLKKLPSKEQGMSVRFWKSINEHKIKST